MIPGSGQLSLVKFLLTWKPICNDYFDSRQPLETSINWTQAKAMLLSLSYMVKKALNQRLAWHDPEMNHDEKCGEYLDNEQ